MVSLVGYTNAGKSTLFNYITSAGVYVENQLFATLDPTMRGIVLPDVGKAVLADTVGFISHLPHRLVEAFRATLEEAANADLLLHVVDAAEDERARNIEAVEVVLEEIKADEIPSLLVMNKIDLLPGFSPRIDRDDEGRPKAVWMSAQAGVGIDELFLAVSELLGKDMVHQTVLLGAEAGRLRAKLYESSAVVTERYNEQGQALLEIRMPRSELGKILAAVEMGYTEFEKSWVE
jgi:GTP-binding protein HflX